MALQTNQPINDMNNGFTNNQVYHFGRDKSFVETNTCFVATKHVFFVSTKVCFPRQNLCRDKSVCQTRVCVCVSRQVLSRQAYFSREKTCLLSRQTRFCRCKTFVATEMILVAAPTNETCQLRSSSDTSILCLPSVRRHSLGQRSFSYAAPSVWNSLPCKVRSSNTPTAFKSPLKSHLFKLSY